LRAIALDKTGTITEGKPRLVATEVLPSSVPESQVLLMGGEPGRALRSSGGEGNLQRSESAGKWPNQDFVALAGSRR
jgi:hypothetical protein